MKMNATEAAITRNVLTESDKKAAAVELQAHPLPFSMTLTPPKATDQQTSRMHCAIRCIARQVEWAGRKWSEEEWKRILVAGFYGQGVVPCPFGDSLVVVDVQTRNLSRAQKAEFIDQLYAFGVEQGVEFDDD